MKKTLQSLNLLSLILTIAVNYLVNSKYFGNPAIGEISAKYEHLLTPAGYAFSIWGLIYLGLLAFGIYQIRDWFSKKADTSFVLQIGWSFIFANLFNAAWVVAFVQDMPGLSVILILALFLSLLRIVLRTNMERWDAPPQIIFFIWWPFSLYFGWVSVAVIVNIAAWLVSTGWSGTPLEPEIWAIGLLVIATAIFILMIWRRNMREYASAAAWGIIGIAVKNWEVNPAVAWTALLCTLIILFNAGLHGYQNRATAPFLNRERID